MRQRRSGGAAVSAQAMGRQWAHGPPWSLPLTGVTHLTLKPSGQEGILTPVVLQMRKVKPREVAN